MRRSLHALPAVALAACGGGGAAPAVAPAPAIAPAPTAPAPGPARAGWQPGPVLTFEGMCDASGAIALPGDRVAVVDDEVNQLVVYRTGGGAPLARVPLDPVLALGAGGPEADLEAVTVIGDAVVFAASHGRKKSGKVATSRLRLARGRLALDGDAVAIAPDGPPYTRLLEDLLAAPSLAAFDLAAAAARSPKQPGGLNLEGMTADGEALVIGARSPLFEGRALVVQVGGGDAVFAGGAATIDRHVLLDLGGRGVRGLTRAADGGYLIAAGAPVAEPVGPAVFAWRGGDATPERLAVELGDLNVEAIEVLPDGDALLLSDDGERDAGGVACKRQPDPSQRRFRGVRLAAPR